MQYGLFRKAEGFGGKMSFGNCPICGKFCGNILATTNKAERIIKVTGICKIHGEQDLTDQDWDGDDFCYGGRQDEAKFT